MVALIAMIVIFASLMFFVSSKINKEEIRNIFTALGVTIGTEEDSKALNLEKLRYHKLVIMCDADVDGTGQSWEYTGSWAYRLNGVFMNADLDCAATSTTTISSGCPYSFCL